jgi:nucleoside-diphosphate-sugar epimerase
MLAFRRDRSPDVPSLSASTCLLIAGAGDLGSRLAALRIGRDADVVAVRRRDVAQHPGVRPVRADLATGEGLSRLPRRPDAVVFCVAPDQRDEAAYRKLYVDGLRRLLDAIDTPRLVFVSSTAVYGQDAGEWVTEASATEPPRFNGRVLLEAERELAAHPGGIVLRLSGLYGPGRDALLRRAREGLASRPHFTNRIHIDDAAAALSHLLDLPSPQSLYLGNDDLPVMEHEVQAWVRQEEGLPAVDAETLPATGRRIANTRLRASGWQPVHRDYRSGYSAQLVRPGL